MAANVAVAQDPAGNLKPAKDKSIERIDASSPPSWRSVVPWSFSEPQPEYFCSSCEGRRMPRWSMPACRTGFARLISHAVTIMVLGT
jgi:hypothetical protein